jgi:tol-pal system protein YbgF
MRSRALLPFAPLFVLFTLGCGRSAEERQLDAMRAEIESVRQSRDRADHVDGTREMLEPLVVPQAYAAAAPARVPPTVVEIGSDGQGSLDDASEADPQDTTPRPTIRVLGSTTRGTGRNGWRVEDQIETSAEPGASASPGSPQRSGTLDPEAKRAYDAAYSLVSARRFDEALDALASFLVKWPDHPYANNAMYWRGECYFARGDYQHASEQFDGMLKRYPAGAKAPDSLLKLGMSHQKLGNVMKAKESFDRLQQLYPGSEAARRIPAMRDRASSVPNVPSTPSAPSMPGPSPEEHR